jgi:hypothetical protein
MFLFTLTVCNAHHKLQGSTSSYSCSSVSSSLPLLCALYIMTSPNTLLFLFLLAIFLVRNVHQDLHKFTMSCSCSSWQFSSTSVHLCTVHHGTLRIHLVLFLFLFFFLFCPQLTLWLLKNSLSLVPVPLSNFLPFLYTYVQYTMAP